MDISQQIIRDLREKVGFDAEVDFMNIWKGVPLVFKGRIKAFAADNIVFEVTPPDSICLTHQHKTMILHDIFLTAIQGEVASFDIKTQQVELHNFTYADQGFGKRSMVRVQPKDPIPVNIVFGEQQIPGTIVDVSLNGFGAQIEKSAADNLEKGDSLIVKTQLQKRAIEIPGTVLGFFGGGNSTRLAVKFESDAPGHATVARYITYRRAEIRKEILDAYNQAMEDNA